MQPVDRMEMANCVVALASEKLFKAVLVIVRFIEKTEPIPLLSGSDANAVVGLEMEGWVMMAINTYVLIPR